MRLVVGLGNPGPKHQNQRHNIGFMAADEIVRRHGLSAPRSRFQGDVSEGEVAGEKVLVLKPMTFMNESGRSVGEAVRFYKLAVENVFVIYDELDLAAAKMRVKQGGGNAGHNGLRSIDAHLGDTNYWRVRLGIGHPGDKARVTSHVLGDFSKADRQWVERELAAVATELPALLDGRASDFMSRVAKAVTPPRESAKTAQYPEPAKSTGAAPTSGDGDKQSETAMGNALTRAMNRLKGRS